MSTQRVKQIEMTLFRASLRLQGARRVLNVELVEPGQRLFGHLQRVTAGRLSLTNAIIHGVKISIVWRKASFKIYVYLIRPPFETSLMGILERWRIFSVMPGVPCLR